MGVKAEAIQRGFHRLGLLLGVPALLLAAIVGIQQLREPTGSVRPHMPQGAIAVHIDPPEPADLDLISEQRQRGIVAPPNYIVLGVEVERPENRFHQFIDEGDETPDYTIFQLRDGREIVLGTQDEDAITNAAYAILKFEALSGRAFPFNGDALASGVPVRIAYHDRSQPQNPWPFESNERNPDFTFVGVLSVLGALLYGFFAGVGWVVRGFFPDSSAAT